MGFVLVLSFVWLGFFHLLVGFCVLVIFNDRDNVTKASLLNSKILCAYFTAGHYQACTNYRKLSAFVSTNLSSTDITLKIILGWFRKDTVAITKHCFCRIDS